MPKIKIFYGNKNNIEESINKFLAGVELIDIKQSIDNDHEVITCYVLMTVIYTEKEALKRP